MCCVLIRLKLVLSTGKNTLIMLMGEYFKKQNVDYLPSFLGKYTLNTYRITWSVNKICTFFTYYIDNL